MEEIKGWKDFLLNDDFIKWQLTGDEKLGGLWSAYLKDNPDRTGEFDRAIRMFRKIKIEGDTLSSGEKTELLSRIKRTVSFARKRKRRILVSTAAAACLFLTLSTALILRQQSGTEFSGNIVVGHAGENESITLTGSSGVLTFDDDVDIRVDPRGNIFVGDSVNLIRKGKIAEEMNTLNVPYGRRSGLTLSDGTKVWVNSGSTITFPTEFLNDKREIEVTGEVFVDVAHDADRQFIIHSRGFDVKVYGTKFNLSVFNDEPVSLVLVEGSVAVSGDALPEIEIKPEEKICITDNGYTKEVVDVSEYISWKEGYMLFNNTPITEVLTKIGRYYNIVFETGNPDRLRSVTCFGKIYLSPDVNNVMQTISLLSSSRFREEGKTIFLDFGSHT